MKLRLAILATAVITFAGLANSAEPELMSLVMPDAKSIGGINIAQAKISPFGQFLLSKTQAFAGTQLKDFTDATGFDPRADLQEIIAASPGDPNQKTGVILARGRFDAKRITDFAKGLGAAVQDYKGVTLLVSPVENEQGLYPALAFLDDSTAIAGDEASVRGAIDRKDSPSSIDPALAAKVSQLRTSQDAWGVSFVPPSAFANQTPDPNLRGVIAGDLIKAIEQTSGGIKFSDPIQITGNAVAHTDKDATALADVVRFFVNMAQMNPPPGAHGAVVTSLLQSFTVGTSANTVNFSLSIAEKQLENLIDSAHPHARKASFRAHWTALLY